MNHRIFALFALIILLISQSLNAGEKLSAKAFARQDDTLDWEEAAMFLAHRMNIPLSKLATNGVKVVRTIDANGAAVTNIVFTASNVVNAMEGKLSDLQLAIERLRKGINTPPPWTWQQVDAAVVEDDSEAATWRKIKGLTAELKLGANAAPWSLGPVRLRKNPDEIRKPDIKQAKGATIGYSDNRLIDGNGAWNSEGVLFYPVKKALWDSHGSGNLEAGPLVGWKLAEAEESNKADVQELEFSLPTTLAWVPSGGKGAGSAIWLLQARPYFNTDFSFGHEIYGVGASVEYLGSFFGWEPFHFGSYYNLAKLSWLQYQLRVIPKLDYSVTEEAGEHTKRTEDDDWFRAGAKISLDFRMAKGIFQKLEVGAAYTFLETVSGSGGYSDVWEAKATWWLIDNAGLTLEYAKGETPVTDKALDLIKLGLELKY